MEMDNETLTLILEFLLRQPIPNPTLTALLSALPLPINLSPRLIHSVLLRHLTFPFSDQTLTTLELLHQFHNNSNSLQTAYSAVAVYLTVRILRKEGFAEFIEAVNSLWRMRIGDLEKGNDRGLVTERLRRARRIMERAVGCELVREELWRRDVSRIATESVEIFLKEAVQGLGLTGLEAATELLRRKEARVKGKKEFKVPAQAQEFKVSNRGECSGSEFVNEHATADKHFPACTQVAEKSFPTTSEVPPQAGRNEVLVPALQVEASSESECSISGFSQHSAPEPIQREARLKQGHEKDPITIEEPLPEVEAAKAREEEKENHRPITNEHAQDLNDDPDYTNTSDGHNRIHNDAPQPNAMEREISQNSFRRSKRVYNSLEKGKKSMNMENTCNVVAQKEQRLSIMERNPTARTLPWHEDSLDSSVEASPIPKKKPCKSHQQERKNPAASLLPLNISLGGPIKKEWTPDEEDVLRKAVAELGTSSWNLVKTTFPVFQSRTLEGLRNKWRHMNRNHSSKK